LTSPLLYIYIYYLYIQVCLRRRGGSYFLELSCFEILRKHAFSLAGATGVLQNIAQVRAVTCRCLIGARKHSAGVRFRLSVPLGRLKTLRRRAFLEKDDPNNFQATGLENT
jgi:hypothetical protein